MRSVRIMEYQTAIKRRKWGRAAETDPKTPHSAEDQTPSDPIYMNCSDQANPGTESTTGWPEQRHSGNGE